MELEEMTTEEKVRKYFDGMCVRKDATIEQFAILSIPSFIRDWFIKKYADEDGSLNVAFVSQLIKQILPRKADWDTILDKMISEHEEVKFIAKCEVKRDVKSSSLAFELPDLGVNLNETRVREEDWAKFKEPFLKGNGPIWGLLKLRYVTEKGKRGDEHFIELCGFQGFKPYNSDLKYFKQAREKFTLDEWIDVLLGAMDYNAEGFKSEEEKLFMLTRLLTFVEKRLNIIELAPKGTGKSYVFSKISKYGWLASGGIMTRAKMFYDMQLKEEGLVSNYDYIALDEIATIRFGNISEMQGAMKGYLESGVYTVGIKEGKGDAGVVLLGNIDKSLMNVDLNMFGTLPEMFQDSALIDRFHGFVEGWKIPRMSEDKKINGWALNSEYFSEILHDLREDLVARSIVDSLVEIGNGADTRDVTAIKRLASAHMKLLFPHWAKVSDVDKEQFKKYCLDPAVRMRNIVKKQLGIMDSEFRGKEVPEVTIVED